MRKTLIPVFLLLLGGMVLGATVLREPLANAASSMSVLVANSKANPIPVAEQNLDTSGNIKVHEQGTASVNVTNSSLSVAASPPVTNGGGARAIRIDDSGETTVALSSPVTASALTIAFFLGGQEVRLNYQGSTAADITGFGVFGGPIGGPERVPLALIRPVKFDSITCAGEGGGQCAVGWVGDQP